MNGETKPIPDRITELLRDAIETETRLGVLLLLWREPTKRFDVESVAAALFVTPEEAERDLAALCGRGFLAVILGDDVTYRYRPATPELERDVEAIARAHANGANGANGARRPRTV